MCLRTSVSCQGLGYVSCCTNGWGVMSPVQNYSRTLFCLRTDSLHTHMEARTHKQVSHMALRFQGVNPTTLSLLPVALLNLSNVPLLLSSMYSCMHVCVYSFCCFPISAMNNGGATWSM